MYRYNYDPTPVGDLRLDRTKYQLIQDALQHLLAKVEEYNNVALQHGAIAKPYGEEETDAYSDPNRHPFREQIGTRSDRNRHLFRRKSAHPV